jgi:hypothetical protein
MNTTLQTRDAVTFLDVPDRFDVTHLPNGIADLIESTENPFHAAMLKNYYLHAVREISGYWDQILIPELTIDEPAYRISVGGNLVGLNGHAEVLAMYRGVAETGQNVMGTLCHNISVAAFGVVTEAVLVAMVPPGLLSVNGLDVDPDAYYMVKHNLMQNFTHTHEAKLISERVYDDPGIYECHKLVPEDVVTPRHGEGSSGPASRACRGTCSRPTTGTGRGCSPLAYGTDVSDGLPLLVLARRGPCIHRRRLMAC